MGSILKKWTLDALLGVGGMAAVYAATHKNRNRVAIKLLHRELSTNRFVRERFQREAYVANTVDHPGAVKVLDDDVSDEGDPFLVMELLDGEALDVKQRRDSVLPVETVVEYADQLLDVLAAAHSRGIVHRDIKPANLFVTRAGIVKVLDFGVARLFEGTASVTLTGTMIGTPAFMPPEQAGGRSAAVGPASDLWSVAATMFTLLTGKFVHEAENAQAHLIAAAITPARSIASVKPDLPVALVRVIDRALSFQVSDRWESAAAMQGALRAARRLLLPSFIPVSEEVDDEKTHAMTRASLAAMLHVSGHVAQPLTSAPQPPVSRISPEQSSTGLTTTEHLSAARQRDPRGETIVHSAGAATWWMQQAPPPPPSRPGTGERPPLVSTGAQVTAPFPPMAAPPPAQEMPPPPAALTMEGVDTTTPGRVERAIRQVRAMLADRTAPAREPLPEARSLWAQAISQVVRPIRTRSRPKPIELAVVVAGVLAIVAVIVLIARAWGDGAPDLAAPADSGPGGQTLSAGPTALAPAVSASEASPAPVATPPSSPSAEPPANAPDEPTSALEAPALPSPSAPANQPTTVKVPRSGQPRKKPANSRGAWRINPGF